MKTSEGRFAISCVIAWLFCVIAIVSIDNRSTIKQAELHEKDATYVKEEPIVQEIEEKAIVVKHNTNHWDIDTMNLKKILKFEEGLSLKPYLCSENYVTIGFGTKLSNVKGLDPSSFTLVITEEIAELLLHNDVAKFDKELERRLGVGSIYKELNSDRRATILSMAYQMGVSGVSSFKKMWVALDNRQYDEAAKQALDSLWAVQTPARAERHARVLRGESLEEVYGSGS